MLQRGSAVQLFNGFDTRQLKVSNDNTKNASFDFKSVLNDKSFESRQVEQPDTQPKSDRKLNKHEMTSRKRPEVKEAKADVKDDVQEVNHSKSEASNQVNDESKINHSEASKESDEITAVKKLLKKLGMTDEEVDAMLEMLPDEMVANLIQTVEALPQMNGFTLTDGDLKTELSKSIEGLQENLKEIVQFVSGENEVTTEIKLALETISAKLENAQLSLESMEVEEFAQVLETVQESESVKSEVRAEFNTDVEVVEVKVIEPQNNDSITKVDGQVAIEQDVKANASDQEANSENPDSSSKDQPMLQTQATESAEQTPSQVDQMATEMIKVENTIIQNTQPMEHTSGRVRLAQNIMNQVMDGVKPNLNLVENGQQIVLKLRPEELGTVDLKLSVEKGILMAEFNVESQIVKETLESNMADLKQALSEKGYNIEGMQVSVGQDQADQQSQFENRFFNQNSQRKYFFGNEDELPDFESINKTLAGLQSTFEYLG